MGKMERKRNWRPLICLGLRALMKPLLPSVIPCCSAVGDTQGRASGAMRAAEAFLQWQEAGKRLPRALGRDLQAQGLLPRPAATLRSATPGSWGGAVPAVRFNLLALMGRERAVRGGKELFEEIFDDRMPISGWPLYGNPGWGRENTWELAAVRRNFYHTWEEQSKSPA